MGDGTFDVTERGLTAAVPSCPVALDDQAFFGNCLQASSVPVLGMLYPLSSESSSM